MLIKLSSWNIYCLLNRLYFIWAVWVDSKIEYRKYRIPIYLLPQYIHTRPHYQHASPEWYIYYNQ